MFMEKNKSMFVLRKRKNKNNGCQNSKYMIHHNIVRSTILYLLTVNVHLTHKEAYGCKIDGQNTELTGKMMDTMEKTRFCGCSS